MPIVNGTPLFVESTGDGEPLILLHGSWAEHRAWALVVPGFSRSFRTVAYDRRGHSQSTADPLAGTIQDDVEDLAALIRHLGLAPAHIVGNSSGACIALRFAAEYPELVRKVAVHEPPLTGLLADDEDTRPLYEAFRAAVDPAVACLQEGRLSEGAERFVDDVALGPGTWAAMPEQVRGMFIANALTFLGEMRDPDMPSIDAGTLGRVRAPVLATSGTESPAMFGPILDRVCDWLPDVTRDVFDGAGHVPQATHPDEFVGRLEDFLGQ